MEISALIYFSPSFHIHYWMKSNIQWNYNKYLFQEIKAYFYKTKLFLHATF